MCWCSNQTQPGGCTENGPFNVPGGVIRIGNSKEFQYVTRPEDPPDRENDQNLSYLLAIPLPLLFCGAIIIGVRKLQSTKLQADPEAPPVRVFEPPAVLTRSQKREKHSTEVKEVLETRTRVAGYVEWKSHQEDTTVQDTVLALYGLTRHHTVVEKMKQEKLTHQGSVNDFYAATSGTATGRDDSDSEMDEEMGEGSKDGSKRGSKNGEASTGRTSPGKKNEFQDLFNAPDPPKLKFKATSNKSLMGLMDIQDFSDGDIPGGGFSDAGSGFS